MSDVTRRVNIRIGYPAGAVHWIFSLPFHFFPSSHLFFSLLFFYIPYASFFLSLLFSSLLLSTLLYSSLLFSTLLFSTLLFSSLLLSPLFSSLLFYSLLSSSHLSSHPSHLTSPSTQSDLTGSLDSLVTGPGTLSGIKSDTRYKQPLGVFQGGGWSTVESRLIAGYPVPTAKAQQGSN